MTRFPTLIAVTVLTFFLSSAAMAVSYQIPPLPQLPGPDWTVGSSATYNFAITSDGDLTRCNLRTAVLGTETDPGTNETLYWFEVDFTNITGLPSNAQDFFLQSYGEPVNAVRINMLIPELDLTMFIRDPSRAYYELTNPGFVRKVYFQYNRQRPMDVDTSLITGFIIPLVANDLLGGDIPEDFVTARNIGIELVENTQMFATEVSESTTTTDAGSFDGNLYSFTSRAGGSSSGLAFYSEILNIFPLVSFISDWTNGISSTHTEIELTNHLETGARSDIVGEPVLFDINSLLYGM